MDKLRSQNKNTFGSPEKAVSAYFTSKLILPIGFADQYVPNCIHIERNYSCHATVYNEL